MPRLLASRTNNLTDRFINGRDLHPYLKRDFWLNTSNQFWNNWQRKASFDFSKPVYNGTEGLTRLYTPASRAYFESNLQTINEHGK